MDFLTQNKRRLRKWMKENIARVAEYVRTLKFSARSSGIIIRTSHYLSPYGFMFILLCGPLILCNLVMFFVFGAIISFNLFDCCFLSLLEQNLCQDDFNIMDPLLELADLEVNAINRYIVSMILGPSYVTTACLLYYIRFIM